MNSISLRTSQLVTTYGPGALINSQFGETMMIGPLDKWYYNNKFEKTNDIAEFEINEIRLRSYLGVDKLYRPPDYRGSQFSYMQETLENADLFMPLLRFPKYHYCDTCYTLHELSMDQHERKRYCVNCEVVREMIQVPFIMICAHGHIADFPWREWVHRDDETTCEKNMKLIFTGKASLDSLKVKCSCKENMERSLKGVMRRSDDEVVSNLGKRLNESGEVYSCPGKKPWMGSEDFTENCNSTPVAALKNSLNLYYSNKISALYIPGESLNVSNIISLLQNKNIKISDLDIIKNNLKDKITFLKDHFHLDLSKYDQEDIEHALLLFESKSDNELVDTEDINKSLKAKEYETLVNELNSEDLKIKLSWEQNESEKGIKALFSKVNKILRLKETIVFTGFTRLNYDDTPNNYHKIKEGRKNLFIEPNAGENNWLPAINTFGEGIFFTLDKEKLDEWAKKPLVQEYFTLLKKRFENVSFPKQEFLEVENVLVHTFSHLIMEEISVLAGYNSTSLRERLYIDDKQVGVLIYTTAEDLDGTFGGLVRLAEEESFFNIINGALNNAKWCSSDPVCKEIGRDIGQGIDKTNGAACHNCSYIAETSCMYNNMYLDRNLLIDNEFGFFIDND